MLVKVDWKKDMVEDLKEHGHHQIEDDGAVFLGRHFSFEGRSLGSGQGRLSMTQRFEEQIERPLIVLHSCVVYCIRLTQRNSDNVLVCQI